MRRNPSAAGAASKELSMKYPNDEYRARYARAYKACQILASMMCYRTEEAPAFIPPPLREGMNVPAENLCLLPTADGYPYDLTKAVRETRTTVLLIEPGSTTDGRPTFYFTVIICRAGEVEHHPAMRLWASLERKLYLAPDPDGGDPEGECFGLHRGVRAAAAPWPSTVERNFGLLHADALLLAP